MAFKKYSQVKLELVGDEVPEWIDDDELETDKVKEAEVASECQKED